MIYVIRHWSILIGQFSSFSERMKRSALFTCVVMMMCAAAHAHDVITTPVTWDREISRIFYSRCVACHREGGAAFSLGDYKEAFPWRTAIKEEVLERRMPPWGAVKGFGSFKDDQGLTQEQIELISDWVEGGAPEGDPKLVGQVPDLPTVRAGQGPAPQLIINGSTTLKQSITVAGIKAKTILEGTTVQVIARRPDGTIEPLIWLYKYQPQFDHPYYFRTPLQLPAGTKIELFPVAQAFVPALLLTSAPKQAH